MMSNGWIVFWWIFPAVCGIAMGWLIHRSESR